MTPAGWRHLLWPVAACVVIASAWMAASNDYTTYGGAGSWWLLGEVATASVLVVTGFLLSAGAYRREGAALLTTGLLWLVPEWGGWAGGPAVVRVTANAVPPVVLAAAVSAVATGLGGMTAMAERLVKGVVVAASAAFVAQITFVDSFLDERCWRYCGKNPLVVAQGGLIGPNVVRVGTLFAIAASVVAIGVSVSSHPEPRRFSAARTIAGLGGVALVAGLAIAAAARLMTVEDPQAGPFRLGFVLATAGGIAVGVVRATDHWREWRVREALSHLVEDLRSAPPPGTLEVELARTLGDPSVRLYYWSVTHGRYVDAAGRVVDPPGSCGECVTTIVRRGQPLAAVTHTSAIDSYGIQRALRPSVRLLLENEQLQVATLAELIELQASRTRIVQRGDVERRQLERNLHDGAQQRIVGVALLVRALASCAGAVSPTVADLIARAERLVATTLDDLRRVARGIYPAVLADGGLRAAVADIAESSRDVAIHIRDLPHDRYSSAVEAAAYLVVAEAVADARRRGASELTIAGAHQVPGTLVIDLIDDALPRGDGSIVTDLEDRVGALGGRLAVSRVSPVGKHVRLEIPCGS